MGKLNWGWIFLSLAMVLFLAVEAKADQGLTQTAKSMLEKKNGPAAGIAADIIAAQTELGQLSAHFSLKIAGAGPDGKDFNARGMLSLATHRHYRVQYDMPEKQLLISNGSKRWLYLEKINQVQIQSLPPEGKATEFFLELGGGLPHLLERCQVSPLPALAGRPASRGYALIPKLGESLDFQRAQIWVEGPQARPVKTIVEAARRVEVDFTEVKTYTLKQLGKDPKQVWPEAFFELIPPQEAEVIEGF